MGDGTFGDEGIIEGAGTAGQDMLDWGDKIMYNPEEAQFVMYYGISSWVLLFVASILYWGLNNHFWGIAALSKGWELHMITWWPYAIIWMATAFWDAEWLRGIFNYATILTLGGPFAGNWICLSYMFNEADAQDAWGYWELWVMALIWSGYTVFAMIMQASMVPKILSWIKNAPINANKREDSDDNERLLATDVQYLTF